MEAAYNLPVLPAPWQMPMLASHLITSFRMEQPGLGKWKYRFNPRFTEIRPFLTDKGIQVMVPMMYREGWFQLQYFPHMHSHVLQLPYTCNISGVFILPNEGKFEESEKALLEESFDTWIKPLPLSMRRLYFPKFSISVDLPLEHFKYPTSGLSLFYEHMDLSGIALPNAPLKVTTALHRVELTMDEDGAEEEDISSFPSLPNPLPPLSINFNRPFMVLFVEENSNRILIVGKVMNPGK